MTQAQFLFLFYLGLMLISFIFEIGFSKLHFHLNKTSKSRKFNLARYIIFLFFPLLTTFIAAYLSSLPFIYVFFAFAFLGTFLEWTIGYAYNKVMGIKMWKYYRWSIGGYTSLLSIPIWGMAGVFFWLLVRAITQ